MKRRFLSLMLVGMMLTTALTGCKKKENEVTNSNTATQAVPNEGKTEGSNDVSEGKVLNIYCWNEEFKSRLTDHYPAYQAVDATNGKIGDVKVVWHITPSDNNAYQENLDTKLLNQEKASADDKIDLFLIEADYALKYVDTDFTMSIEQLGITEGQLAEQYKYTKDVVTDSNGVLKGLSWQAAPGILFYNREVAKEVLGTDNPDEIQAYVANWDKFVETAQVIKDAGYYMTSSVMDSYRVYSNNVSSK